MQDSSSKSPTASSKSVDNETAASILLIDDHPMLRNGIRQLVSMRQGMTIVAETSNGYEGVELAKLHDPDVILLDIHMPEVDGLKTLSALRDNDVASRIIMFTVSNYQEDVTQAIKLGADGYLLKDMEPEDILAAIEQVCLGQMAISPDLTRILADGLRNKSPIKPSGIEQLTKREKEILKLIAQGLSNKLIARQLMIADSTVKVHVKHLLKKLNLRSRVEVAVWVHQEGIFD